MSNQIKSEQVQGKLEALQASLQSRFGDLIQNAVLENKEITLEIDKKDISEVCVALRDEAGFNFEQLIDLCGIDYLLYGKSEWQTEDASWNGFSRAVAGDINQNFDHDNRRYAVVYHLMSIVNNQRLRLRVYLESENLIIDSVNEIWPAVNWFEREAFDLFGILFEGHNDLRRILTDYGFVGHPFRKDFPLSGYVEMRYDEVKKRVVYEPVSIEPRINAPKVIRKDHRYHSENTDGETSGSQT